MSDIKAITKAIQETKNKLAKSEIIREAIIRVPIILHEENTDGIDSKDEKEVVESVDKEEEPSIEENTQEVEQGSIPIKPYCKVSGYKMVILIPSTGYTSQSEVIIDGQKYTTLVVRTPDVRSVKLQDISPLD